jgi:hypothetical protein
MQLVFLLEIIFWFSATDLNQRKKKYSCNAELFLFILLKIKPLIKIVLKLNE